MKKMLWSIFGMLLMFTALGNVSIMSGPLSYQPPVPSELIKED